MLRRMTAVLALLLPMKAEAGTSRCAVIPEHDARMMCFAVATKNSSYCAFIKDATERNKCYILVGG